MCIMMTMKATKTERVLVLFEKTQLDLVEEFRFKNRFASRNEALRWLIDFALKQRPKAEQK